MTADPWSLHRDLSCPKCHVLGKVVRFEREDGGYQCGCDEGDHVEDVDPFTCVECGHGWIESMALRPEDIKEARVNWSRLVEGRPYEPPAPPKPDQNQKSPDLSFMEQMLKDHYGPHRDTLGPLQFASVRKAGNEPGEYSIAVPVSATGISSSFEISLQAMPMYGPQEWVEVAPPGTCIKRTNPPGVGEDE
jgi:hypothetical protein